MPVQISYGPWSLYDGKKKAQDEADRMADAIGVPRRKLDDKRLPTDPGPETPTPTGAPTNDGSAGTILRRMFNIPQPKPIGKGRTAPAADPSEAASSGDACPSCGRPF